MKIRPLHDRVIVKRLDEEKKTASGIVIPDTAAEKPDQARSRRSARERGPTKACSCRSTSRSETGCCSENIRGRPSG